MKKIFFTALLALAVVSVSNAQWYAGGSLGFDYNSFGADGVDDVTTFTITPRVGYMLNDRMSVGLNAEFTYAANKDMVWAVAPFFRYELARWNKLALQMDAGIDVRGFSPDQGDGWTAIGVFVSPALTYDFTSRLSIETTCNLFRFGFDYNLDSEDMHIGLGVNGRSFYNRENFTFGVYYKF